MLYVFWVYLRAQMSVDASADREACDDGHMPSIYLSMLSHCVLPVDRRYRMCCWDGRCQLSMLYQALAASKSLTMSCTLLCLSNSCLAKSLVSSRVFESLILRVERMMVR